MRNTTMPKHNYKFAGAGHKLAEENNWHGRNISRVYLDALTDANFHTLRKKVAKLVNKELQVKLRLTG